MFRPSLTPPSSSPCEEQLPQQVDVAVDLDELLYSGGSNTTTTTSSNGGSNKSRSSPSAQEDDKNYAVRRGPWTVDEDRLLVNYIASHGEGRWNSLARSAGLNRTGKSCRLRWLNYLRPEVRRGNITPEEQLLILELHSRWGNRWSRIAEQLPGRTDNEIKNYWRTRVQKHAKQLRCDVDSDQFKDLVRYLWMPRLLERVRNSHHRNATHPPVTVDSSPNNYNNNNCCSYTTNTNTNTNSSPAAVGFSSDSDSTPYQLEEEITTPDQTTINEDKNKLLMAAGCWCPDSTTHQIDYPHNQTAQMDQSMGIGMDSIWCENDVIFWPSHISP